MKQFVSLLAGLGILSNFASLAAEEDAISVDEIVQRANQVMYSPGRDSRVYVKMTITDRRGRERKKEFTLLRRDQDESGEEQNFYVYFHQPADVRGTALLTWKHSQKDDDRWLYLPALDVVKRIAGSDERSSFVGSHFFYEDMTGRRPNEDNHQLTRETEDYYVITSQPKKPQSVEFDSYLTWIHKESFVPVKLEFAKGDKVYRTIETLAVERVQGFQTVIKLQVTDIKSGGWTMMEYQSVEYDLGLAADIFTEQYLRNPPQELIGRGKD